MISLQQETRAAYAFVERNFNLMKRYWGWEVVWLVYSIANSLSITYIGAGMERISGVGRRHRLPGALPAHRHAGLALPLGGL